MDAETPRATKIREIRKEIFEDECFSKLFKDWKRASEIRKWITDKKKNLSKKLEDAARSELTKMKLEAETKLKEEVKEKPTETIDTMSKEVT